MENVSFHIPVYVVNAGIATSGHSADLAGGKVGLFDRATFSVATASGNGKEFYFAQGTLGGKDWYGFPIENTSHKSPFFYGTDVESMYLSTPSRRQNEEWVIGYNGADSSKGIRYFQDAEPVKIQFLFTGGPSYRYFGGPKQYTVSMSPDKDCTLPCSGDCTDTEVDPLWHVKKHIDKINNHVELQKFGVRAQLVTNEWSATSVSRWKFRLSICDNGDGASLNLVKAQYPLSYQIKRVERKGSTSVYEVCLSSDSAPSNFTYSTSVKLSVCGSCSSIAGSTIVPSQDWYIIERPLAGTEDINSDVDKLAFARSVAATYFGKTFDATTAVDDTTETITTPTAHGFSEGQAVVFSVASGLMVGGITAGTTYYVISAGLTSTTFRVAETRGGSAVNLTDAVGTVTVTPAGSSFLGNTGATALIKVAVPSGTSVTPINADTVTFSYTEESSCISSAPASVAWVAAGTGVSGSRTMKISQLKRPDCDANGDRLADLTAILSGVAGINIGSLTKIEGDACHDDYTVEQYSIDCLTEEACLTNQTTFTYDTLPTLDNQAWSEVVAAPNSSPFTVKVGIRITADYKDIRFGNDSFDKSDYYETNPLKMEVSVLREWAGPCDVEKFPSVVQTKYGQIERQSGEWVVREVICKTDAYQRHMQQYSDSPRMREAFDQNLLNMVDRNAFYNLYYVRFRASYGKLWRKNEQEKFTAIFAFKEDDPAQEIFKSNVLDVLTLKSGVTMHINN